MERPIDGQFVPFAFAEYGTLVSGYHMRYCPGSNQCNLQGADTGEVTAVVCEDLHYSPIDRVRVLCDHGE